MLNKELVRHIDYIIGALMMKTILFNIWTSIARTSFIDMIFQ